MNKLIVQTTLYGHRYKGLADCVNSLYSTEYRDTIEIILRAFAERDFEEIVTRYNLGDDVDYDSLDLSLVVDNLDENDLETIIKFCGVSI